MYVIATFESSIFLELAITSLEQKGITSDNLMAVPLDKRTAPRLLFDSIHRADGFSMFDAAAILGTVFMLLGAIYGYVLKWGPIHWGIIGAASGFFLGFLIRFVWLKRQSRGSISKSQNRSADIVLMILCDKTKWEAVEKILWDNLALGVARVLRE
jgi:hypothetical protein